MELGTQLKVCVALSAIALVLKVIVFVSPGWVVVKHEIREPIDKDLVKIPELSLEKRKSVSISFGLWYYKVCMCGAGHHRFDDDDSAEKNDDEDDERHHHHHKRKKHHRHHKCYHSCYRKKKHPQRIDYVGENMEEQMQKDEDFENGIPPEFSENRDFINNSVEFARHARLELGTYVIIGVVIGIFGLVGSIKYARGRGTGKHSGRLACAAQVFASFFFWLALIRTATYIIQLRILRNEEDGMDQVRFGLPWCLVVGTIGAILMDISALFHLILISRDRRPAGQEYVYNTEKNGTGKVPVIVPKGYEQMVVPYTTEEAGPLPNKQSLA